MRGYLWLALCVGCSGSSSGGASTEQANPCATKNATYLLTFTEQPGGTCGPIPSQVLNINPDATITSSASITCASGSESGCTARGTDCTWTSQGYSFTETYETTFASDGSSAKGVATITGTGNGQSCASTYDTSFVRQ